MKRITRLSIMLAAAIGLSSCSFLQEWGDLSRGVRIIDESEFTLEGRRFVMTRYMVHDNPLETRLVVNQIIEPWAR